MKKPEIIYVTESEFERLMETNETSILTSDGVEIILRLDI